MGKPGVSSSSSFFFFHLQKPELQLTSVEQSLVLAGGLTSCRAPDWSCTGCPTPWEEHGQNLVALEPPCWKRPAGGSAERASPLPRESSPRDPQPARPSDPLARKARRTSGCRLGRRRFSQDCGNETAKQERYHEAVLLFTEAIKLNPQEYRFFGNRSFCYEKLQSHTEALRDAQHALSLQPGWPRGLFRQGKALLGLKRYADAARMFQQLLQFDGFRGDAAIQLQKCRIQHLLESRLGCSRRDRDVLPAEAQLPLSGKQPAEQRCPDSGAQAIATTWLAPPAAKTPVREWFAVWVGNLAPRITQQVLLRYFQPGQKWKDASSVCS